MYFSGMIAGGFSSVILGPFERIKCLVQAQPFELTPQVSSDGTLSTTKKLKYSGAIDCLRKVYKEGGIRSVYRGTLLTFMRDVPSTGFYFLSYEEAKKILNVKEYFKNHFLFLLYRKYLAEYPGLNFDFSFSRF